MQRKSVFTIEKPAGTSKYDMCLHACTATSLIIIYSVCQADRDVSLMNINRKYQQHVHILLYYLSIKINIILAGYIKE